MNYLTKLLWFDSYFNFLAPQSAAIIAATDAAAHLATQVYDQASGEDWTEYRKILLTRIEMAFPELLTEVHARLASGDHDS